MIKLTLEIFTFSRRTVSAIPLPIRIGVKQPLVCSATMRAQVRVPAPK